MEEMKERDTKKYSFVQMYNNQTELPCDTVYSIKNYRDNVDL
jgi:hypothetical protein